MDPNVTMETLTMARDAIMAGAGTEKADPVRAGRIVDVMKAAGITMSNNIMWYDLAPLVMFAFPYTDMLIRDIPRTAGDGGNAHHWQAWTGMNTAKVPFGIGEGVRNAAITFSSKYYTAPYQNFASEAFTTFQAQWASKNLSPDNKAAQTIMNLANTRDAEEKMTLGGNYSLTLGKAVTPTCVEQLTGGAILANVGTVYVYCVALTNLGVDYIGGFGKCAAASTLARRVSRTPKFAASADTVGGYAGRMSDVATCSITSDGNNTHAVYASTTPIQGAAGYAWFVGLSADAGSTLCWVTGPANVTLTISAGLGTTAANNTDLNSATAYEVTSTFAYDGLIPLIFGIGQGSTAGSGGVAGTPDAASGAYVKVGSNGDYLTATGANGIQEIDDMLQDRFVNYNIGIQKFYVGADLALDIRDIIVGGGAAPLYRVNIDAGKTGMALTGGMRVGDYTNPFTGESIPIVTHRYVPRGMLIGYSFKLPYNLPNNAPVVEIKTLQEYMQIDWPTIEMKWEASISLSSVLCMRFGPAFCGLMNYSSKH